VLYTLPQAVRYQQSLKHNLPIKDSFCKLAVSINRFLQNHSKEQWQCVGLIWMPRMRSLAFNHIPLSHSHRHATNNATDKRFPHIDF